MDVVKEGMLRVGVTEKDERDRADEEEQSKEE